MTTALDDATDGRAGPATASARWALGLCTVAGWFFVASAGHATGPLQAVPWIFTGEVRSATLIGLLGLLSLAGFAAPLLPLGAHWSREQVAARAAIATIVAGLLVQMANAAPLAWQARSSALVLSIVAAVIGTAAGALFLNAVVGLVNRRAVAGGLVGALLLRHVPLFYGDAILERQRLLLGFALVFALAGVAFVRGWLRAPAEDRVDSFERRAGGFRLRGAIAFGVLLFFELIYGLPGLASFIHADGDGLGTTSRLIPLAVAWLFVVRGLPVARHRVVAVSLAVVLAVGAILPFWIGDRAYDLTLVVVVAAQCAAFMLFGRALAPASGRRSGRKLATGLAVFVVLTIAYASALVRPAGLADLQDGLGVRTTITLLAGLVLAVAMYLTPRPVPTPAPLTDRWLYAIAAAVPVAGLIVALL